MNIENYNTENSSSKTVRDDTDVIIWCRRNANKKCEPDATKATYLQLGRLYKSRCSFEF